MAFVNIDGTNLFVEIKGSGYPLMLIHGIGGDHHIHFQPVLEPLSEEFKVIALDCRGHGKSDKPESFTLEDHTNDIIGILDFFGISKAHILGVSMGSYIAQSVAINFPDRVERIILTVPKSNGLTSSTERLFKEHAGETAGLNKKEVLLALLKYMVCDPVKMEKHLNVFGTDLTPEQLSAANRAISSFDFRTHLDRVTAKTLVISGKCDGLNPPDEGKEVANLIKDSKFKLMLHSGHAPMFEETETFIEVVKSFLKN